MREPQSLQPPVQRFTLHAPPPVRALAIAAGFEVVGAVLLVLWGAADLPLVVAVLGGVALAFGTVLLVAALLLTHRLRTEVRLEPDAITVVRGTARRSVPWAVVTGVTLQHPRLDVSTADPAEGVIVVNPRTEGDPLFGALLAAIRQRLDDDRGYHDSPGHGPSS